MKKSRKERCLIVAICILCLLTALSEFISFPIASNKVYNRLICNLLPPFFGGMAVILLCKLTGAKIFSKPQNLLYLLPCIVIAIDNFPFAAYFAGKMELVNTNLTHLLLFSAYCICVGLFEEIIFRFFLFSALASRFKKNKRGFCKAYITSAVIFGAAHLLNLVNGANIPATLLQAGYSVLTGGLFGFAFIKTRNILCAAGIHAIYNFCGLLFTPQLGLGNGSMLDLPTILTMTVVCTLCGAFILYKLVKMPEEEVVSFYKTLQIPVLPQNQQNPSQDAENASNSF